MDIMDAIEKRRDSMIERRNKVLPARMDVRFPREYQSDGKNREISTLTKNLFSHYSRQGIDLEYVWAREQNNSHNPHYHFMVFLDGSKVQDPRNLSDTMERLWEGVIGTSAKGLIDHCDHDYKGKSTKTDTMIRRPSSRATGDKLDAQTQAFARNCADVLKRGAYLAKTETKGNTPKRVREWAASKIKTTT